MSCYVTEAEVRAYVSDHETREGMSSLYDLDFTPDQIASAMKSAAREYNGMPPFVSNQHPNTLPNDTNIFFDAISHFLYLQALQEEQRHDVPYTAGNMNVDVSARKIQHFKSSMELFYNRFKAAAQPQKKLLNYNRAFGPVG